LFWKIYIFDYEIGDVDDDDDDDDVDVDDDHNVY
jgi:hypothetical protein